MRNILAFDVTMNGCGVGVTDAEGTVLASRIAPMNRGQAEVLVPMIEDAVAAAGGYGTIDLIAVTRGPGAFTGIRIGLSTARALGLALSRPVVGVSTLDCLAAAYCDDHTQREDILVLIETKRTDFYGQFFSKENMPQGEAFACEARDIPVSPSLIIIGDAGARFTGLLPDKKISLRAGYELPDPAVLARLGLAVHRAGGNTAMPLYLRGADVSATRRFTRTIEE